MCAQFTDDDVGKTVVDANGDEVGLVAVVEGDVAHVEPDPGILDSIKAAIGWDEPGPDTVALEAESVAEITGDAVRLRGDLSESVGAAGATDEGRRAERVERARERTPSTDESRERDRAAEGMAGEERGVDEVEPSDTEGEVDADERPRQRGGEGPTDEPPVDEPADDELETDAAEEIEDRDRESDRGDEDDVAP
ncbi:hypothetical protein [Salinilacihabitans rarus]|uniref:hypothetical protein n=1 Tax=Salinilacihabitans rarus TaxID=2961596 RepID=UPI0020C8A974|nr:hypothetical protein [Salinilacihabitans rarus]